MARASDGHDVGGGVTATPVRLRAEWQALVNEARERGGDIGAPRRVFTAEEDTLIVEGRRAGLGWPRICRELRCNDDTARRRLRELEGA